MNSWKARRPPAWEPPLRTFWTAQSAQDLRAGFGGHTGYGEDVGLLGASQVGDVCVERDTLLGSGGLCDGHGDTEDGVGAQVGLVCCAIELVEESVYGGLVLDVELLLDEGRGNGVVDVADSLGDTLATPLGLVAIAEFAGLVGAGRGTGGDNGAVEAGLGDNVDLDGGVTLAEVNNKAMMGMARFAYPRVVDGAGVDLCDGHGDCDAEEKSIGEIGGTEGLSRR